MLEKKFPHLIFIFFVILHLILFNVNAAEWGDSYRILRGSEYLRDFSYPDDEKRPPLYSILLAFRPVGVDQVFWGRFEMFVINLGAFFVFYKLTAFFIEEARWRNLALMLFALNPVYLYWSLRLMADVPFSLLVLLVFYIVLKRRTASKIKSSVFAGVLTGLAVLMRFEGYLLFAAVFGGLFIENIKGIKKSLSVFVGYLAGFVVTLAPYVYWRNPFTSSYFEEPSNRTYDLNTVAIYLLSLLFVLGVIPAGYFIYYNRGNVLNTLKKYPGLVLLLLMELGLVLAWPAAVPRLFVPIIPFIIIFFTLSAQKFFETSSYNRFFFILFNLGLLGFYILGQFYYKLQFLVLIKPVFAFVLLLTGIQIFSMYKKRYNYFFVLTGLIALIWSISTIWIHKDIFKVVKDANLYVVENLSGTVGYNDISSVSNWYLNESGRNDAVEGVYYDITKKEKATYEALLDKEISYFLVTNEHNTDMEVDISNRPYLEEIAEFNEVINGKLFFTKIIRFDKSSE